MSCSDYNDSGTTENKKVNERGKKTQVHTRLRVILSHAG